MNGMSFTEQKKKNLNVRDLCWVLFDMSFELSRIAISSLLAVFVSQKCGEDLTCTIQDNFTDLTLLNRMALGYNVLTLLALLFMYLAIYKRGKFFIYKLDENAKLPKTNHSRVFMQHPEIEPDVRFHNRRLGSTAIFAAFMYVTNMTLSAVVIFVHYYNGYPSIVQFIVNSGLCVSIIYRSILHSMSKLVLSNTTFVPIAYNDIDRDYYQSKMEENNRLSISL